MGSWNTCTPTTWHNTAPHTVPNSMAESTTHWPDPLSSPEPNRVEQLLADFWHQLQQLGDRIATEEYLLANELTHQLRTSVLEMMLALNGIQRPSATQNLNLYLSEEQQEAISRTMQLPNLDAGAWLGQAVALVVIYRWYAPQLAETFTIAQPHDLESRVLETLCQQHPDWPKSLTTD